MVWLARLQFAFTVSFHYIFPPITIGLSLLIVLMEGLHLKTRDTLYRRMSDFWIRIFGLTFVLGAATGVVMEFEFGTNWAAYSRFVGDVFGSALAAESIFAFFLESLFLAVVLFGRDKVRPWTYFASTALVALGAHLSAFWIIAANSWQQTPAGYHIVAAGPGVRAEITDFWAMVFNPSTFDRFTHAVCGAWLSGAFLVLSVSAFYILLKRHEDFARTSLKIALALALFASLAQLGTGHASAIGVARRQPAKLAAFEGHFEPHAPAAMYVFGWVDVKNERVFGLPAPGLLSLLVHFDRHQPVTGLRAFPPRDRPPVNFVFQSYHLMVAIGMALISLCGLGAWFWWRGTLFRRTWLLILYVPAFLLPQAANQAGWYSAEVGRQPWIVYNLLRTSDAASRIVTADQVMFSLVLFILIYAAIFLLYVFLLAKKIRRGPEPA